MSDAGALSPWEEPLPLTQAERLTQQFYAWEKRGRGWQLWEYPVELEPPFRPFLVHSAPPGPVIDDARKPTFLSSLVDRVRAQLTSASQEVTASSDAVAEYGWDKPEPVFTDPDPNLVELTVALPPMQEVSRDSMEQFLLGLTYATHPVSFEVVGLARAISVQLVCHHADRAQLAQQLQAYVPEAVIREEHGSLTRQWDTTDATSSVIVEFGLSQEFMRPLKVFKHFEVDPLIGITAALTEVQARELGLVQVLFQPVRAPWGEQIIRAVTDWEGDSFFVDAPEMVSLAEQKASRPLFAVVIRVAAQSPHSQRAWQIAKALGGALAQFANPMSNELIPLTNDGYPDEEHQQDVLYRQAHRSGMLLNSEELVSLVHLPSASVRAAKLTREVNKTKAAPSVAVGHRLILGQNHHGGKTLTVSLSPDQRVGHTYMVGASGTGKSTLLLNMILQDIQHGEGVGVLDPHGDLIEKILASIPEARHEDVILVDPQDADYPIGLNILTAHSELEKTLLASDLVALFRRSSASWGDQMNSVFANAILAFLENPRGGTLKDLRRFLIDERFRHDYLKAVQDEEVVFYWKREFPLLIGRPQVPILTRLDTFLRPKLIRNIVSQKENRLNFREILDSGKILLCRLAQGGIGQENAHLLGAFIVSKLQQAVMSRQDVQEKARRHFYCYIDEFQHFITPSMEAILSGARKYHLGLILAHQDLRQIWGRDRNVASSVLANPYTRICFRLGEFDAQKLKEGLAFFGAQDLQNLGVGEAICRVERAEYDFNLTVPAPEPIPLAVAETRKETITALSRARYARPREEVEQEAQEGVAVAAPAEAASVTERPRLQREQPEKGQAVREKAKLSSDERRFLEYVADHPGLFITHIYAAFGLSGYKGDKLKQGLVAKEYLTLEETRLGGGGRLAKVVRLTEQGAKALKSASSSGKGGDLHKELQATLKDQLERYGWKAKIEEKIPGTLESVDVGLAKDEVRVAIEVSVTTHGDHELDNIQKCLETGYDYIVCTSTEEKTLAALKQKARRQFTARERERIRFCVPSKVKDVVRNLTTVGMVSDLGMGSGHITLQKQLLDIAGAAALMGVSRDTLYSWVSQRRVPYVKVGRLTKFDPKSLHAWLERQAVAEQELQHRDRF